ncbi:hypothetical protein [Aeromicrobium sp. 179-A 4D2 NHS]|uniref:hypothetical protein n=1 Tax=Aeromicrobium sp. 179-A 4D2 NHS TaxID=3142375 RepID=UPI0039A2FF43
MSKPGQCVICHHSNPHGHYEGHRCGAKNRHGHACLCDKTARWARVLGLRDANGVGIRVGDVVTVPGQPGAALVVETARKRVTVEWDETSGKTAARVKVPARSVVVMTLDCSYEKDEWEADVTDWDGSSLGGGMFLMCDVHGHPGSFTVYENPPLAPHGPCRMYLAFLGRFDFRELTDPFDKTAKVF